MCPGWRLVQSLSTLSQGKGGGGEGMGVGHRANELKLKGFV